MFTLNRNLILGAVAAVTMSAQICVPAFSAQYYQGYATSHPSKTQRARSYFYRHPKVKAVTIGTGVGTAAGAVTGLVSGRGMMHGALIGAGTGAGVGLIRSSEVMQRHQIIKNTATGSAVGLGLGLAAGHGHHSGLKGAAVGGAVGLGYGALKNILH